MTQPPNHTNFEFNLDDSKASFVIPIADASNGVVFFYGDPLQAIVFERQNGSFVEVLRRELTEEEKLESWLIKHQGVSYRDVISDMVTKTRFDARWNDDVTKRWKH